MSKGMDFFEEQLLKVAWLKPWELLPTEGNWAIPPREMYEDSLRRCLQPKHPLYGRPYRAVAVHRAGPEALFIIDNPGPYLAVVEMDGEEPKESDPSWPHTTIYSSVDEFVEECMKKAQAARNAAPFPGIVCTPGWLGGSPRLEGHRIGVDHVIFGLERESPADYLADYQLDDVSVDDLKTAVHYCRARQCEKDCPQRYCSWCSISEKHGEERPSDVKLHDCWILAEEVCRKLGW
jgi:uncharacterized protein (DUF433 family)